MMLLDSGFDSQWRVIFSLSFVLLFVAYLFVLSKKEKFWFALCIALLRFAWVAPVLYLMWPRKVGVGLEQPLKTKNVYVLLDDSNSMQSSSALNKAQVEINNLSQLCEKFACKVNVKKLSDFHSDLQNSKENASSDYTYMSESLEYWLGSKFDNDPVIVFSDGGDYLSRNLDVNPGKGDDAFKKDASRIYVYFGPTQESNYAITHSRSLGLSFSNQKPSIEVSLQRSEDLITTQRNLQIQVYAVRTDGSEQILATQSFKFQKGEQSIDVGLELPLMTKGQYMLNARLLTPPEDRVAWDNHHTFMLKILPNTVGLLHLLGAPSWDGRFLRRYIKSEIKYDTVSFYILRDPTDLIPEKDRELSLIPFPVERLFTKELSRFKVLIMQNFALSYFLDQEEYRNNLVKFVKEGGGLLFIGGPRALLQNDVQNSSLKEILPFTEEEIRFATSKGKENSGSNPFSGFGMGRLSYLNMSASSFAFMGSSWNASLKYRLKLNELEAADQRRISFWEELKSIGPELEKIFARPEYNWSGLQDVNLLNHPPQEKSEAEPQEEDKPLVQAPLSLIHAEVLDRDRSAAKHNHPFVMASFPGKGRALWILSDEIWKMGNQPPEIASRGLYTKFMQMVFQWLLKEDLRPALQWQNASLQMDERSGLLKVQIVLSGPATLEFEANKKFWTWNLCGQNFESSKFKVNTDSALASLVLKADIDVRTMDVVGKRRSCSISFETQSPAYGNLKNEMLVGIQPSLSDEVFSGSEWNARSLAKSHNLQFVNYQKASQTGLSESYRAWLESFVSGNEDRLNFSSHENLRYWDYFHWLDTYWIVWILVCMTAEVLLQRRKWIFGSRW